MIRSIKYLSTFSWLFIAVGLYTFYAIWGLPHMIWSYTFHDNGNPYDPTISRHYISCTYVGPYGAFHLSARNGTCGWVKFFKSQS